MFIFIHKCSKMNYFRKKSIHDIHKQIAEGSGDSHESLGRHLKTRDLASFGIAAIIGGVTGAFVLQYFSPYVCFLIYSFFGLVIALTSLMIPARLEED